MQQDEVSESVTPWHHVVNYSFKLKSDIAKYISEHSMVRRALNVTKIIPEDAREFTTHVSRVFSAEDVAKICQGYAYDLEYVSEIGSSFTSLEEREIFKTIDAKLSKTLLCLSNAVTACVGNTYHAHLISSELWNLFISSEANLSPHYSYVKDHSNVMKGYLGYLCFGGVAAPMISDYLRLTGHKTIAKNHWYRFLKPLGWHQVTDITHKVFPENDDGSIKVEYSYKFMFTADASNVELVEVI